MNTFESLQIGFVLHFGFVSDLGIRASSSRPKAGELALFFQLGLNHEEHEGPRRIVNRQRQSLQVSCSPRE